MTPEDFSVATQTAPEHWNLRRNGERVAFDELVLQSVLNHPILAFQKGERPLDSRMPRELRADLHPSLRRAGARVEGQVRVTNTGDTLWRRGGDEAGAVRLGLQLLTPERRLLDQDFARSELPMDLAPGATADLAVAVSLPDAAAPYVLKLDMVDEHVCWFQDRGGRPVYVTLD